MLLLTQHLFNQEQLLTELNVVSHKVKQTPNMVLANTVTLTCKKIQTALPVKQIEMTTSTCLLGIRLETPRLILECSMLITLKPMDGLNADGQPPMKLHSFTLLLTPPTGIQFAT